MLVAVLLPCYSLAIALLVLCCYYTTTLLLLLSYFKCLLEWNLWSDFSAPPVGSLGCSSQVLLSFPLCVGLEALKP
jgi:hypothetical protein